MYIVAYPTHEEIISVFPSFQQYKRLPWFNICTNKYFYVPQLNIVRMWKQLEYFQQFQVRLTDIVGADRTREIISNGISLISLGGNDFVNNYYLVPLSARSRQFSLPDYVRYVVSEYRNILSVNFCGTMKHFFGKFHAIYGNYDFFFTKLKTC